MLIPNWQSYNSNKLDGGQSRTNWLSEWERRNKKKENIYFFSCCFFLYILLPFCWGVWCSAHTTRARPTRSFHSPSRWCLRTAWESSTHSAVCTRYTMTGTESKGSKAALSSSKSNRNRSSTDKKKTSRTTVSLSLNAKKYQTRREAAAAAAAAVGSPFVVNIHNDDGFHQRQGDTFKEIRTISRSFRFPFRTNTRTNERMNEWTNVDAWVISVGSESLGALSRRVYFFLRDRPPK